MICELYLAELSWTLLSFRSTNQREVRTETDADFASKSQQIKITIENKKMAREYVVKSPFAIF